MKKILLVGIILLISIISCSQKDSNPFYSDYDTPFGVPPFCKIKDEHYLPAFQKGIQLEKQEVLAIANSSEEPTFDNTIAQLERSGKLLTKVNRTFYNLLAANTNDVMDNIAEEIAPILAKHNDEINLNSKLFERVKKIYDNINDLNLNPEQNKLVDDYYKSFVRSGALLNESEKDIVKEINGKLSLLTLKFGNNILKENNKFELVVTNENDLAGLSESSINAAAETAKEKGYENSWVFTIHKPSMIPFLQFAENRELREKLYKGYINKGDNNDELDNKEIIKEIIQLRLKRAQILGYKTHADFVLEERMAKKSDNVLNLLAQIWEPALAQAKVEAYDLQKIIEKENNDFKLASWDWWFYAEKLKKEKYGLDEDEVRQYFQLENVRQGAFDVATKLWGITFTKLDNLPVYHEDVEVFEVNEADGEHIGILYTDYFPRASKGNGAWMDAFRKQKNMDEKMVRPIIYNVGNFTKPSGDKPSLLNFDEVETLFHEFGHALHGLLSNCSYPSISGTSTPTDFVELPSQIMENWASHPEVIKNYAKHYKTGEPIPADLLEKIKKAGQFNMGFITLEYMAASLLDMSWYALTDVKNIDVNGFEKSVLNEYGLIPEIISRYRSTYFKHIFSGGYSAGYYGYIWAEVLDSDAFEAFMETSLYDQATAKSFRENILERGGTDDAMILYKKFRGKEPKIDPLLVKRGLK